MNSRKIIKIDSNHDDSTLIIEYDLGNVCNYSCHYCFPESNTGTVKWPDLTTAVSGINTIINFYRQNGKTKFIIDLIGGEVTIWKDIATFVTEISSDDVLINIITNGSRSLSWWKQYGNLFGRVAISFHPTWGSTKHIAEVADLLYSKNVYTEVSVSIDPTNFELSEQLIVELEKLSKFKWGIFRNEILIDGKNIYTPDQNDIVKQKIYRYPDIAYYASTSKLPLKYYLAYSKDSIIPLQTTARELMLTGNRHFYGWHCNLGIDLIYISRTGRLTGSCGNRLYQLTKYYNIYDANFNKEFFPTLKPAKCHTVQCSCDREIEIRKQVAYPINVQLLKPL